MSPDHKKKIIILCISFLIAAASFCSSVSAEVRREPSVKESVSYNNLSGYPERFDGAGRLFSISEKSIVIDDVTYYLADSVSYNRPGVIGGSSSAFRPGVYLGYIFNSDGKIVSMWIIDEKQR